MTGSKKIKARSCNPTILGAGLGLRADVTVGAGTPSRRGTEGKLELTEGAHLTSGA